MTGRAGSPHNLHAERTWPPARVPRPATPALGAAIGANPLLIVRPCHRVVGSDGTMRGYVGGVERKHQLLALEGVLLPI